MENEIFKSKKSINLIILLKDLGLFILFFVLWKAGIKGNIYPFATGLFVALCWCNQNIYLMSAMFILTGFLSSLSLGVLVFASSMSAVIVIIFNIHKLIKKPIKKYMLCIYCVVSQALLVIQNLGNAEHILSAIICIIISTIFLLSCVNIFKALLVRGVGFKLTIDEIISLCFLLSSISLGLTQIKIFDFELNKVFVVFTILLSSVLFKNAEPVVIAIVLGLGEALGNASLVASAGYAILGICAISFRTNHSYYSVLSVIFADLILGLYFKIYAVYNLFSVISLLIGVSLFMLIRKNTLSLLKIIFGCENIRQVEKNIVNKSRNELCKKMYEMSNIFFEMNRTFRSMTKGVLPAQEVKTMLSQEVKSKVCMDCPERFKCHRAMEDETNKVFDEIISAGLERGKTTIIDVPPFLSTRCGRINIIMQSINQLLNSYKQYSNMMISMDTSKILLADQLEGISNMLKKLALQTQKNITFDVEKENEIIEELKYVNINVNEVAYCEENTDATFVSICIKKDDKDNENITRVLNKVCKCKMNLISSQVSNTPNFYINEYKTAPKYDLVYGSCGTPKIDNQISGDTYSFIKLVGDKVLIALCDGMGSGEQAQQTSETALGLIENFYKAGFDNDLILNSVNKFLTLKDDDNYSALDIMVIDLKTSSADFVKVGAVQSLIKKQSDTEILEAGALPLGILEEMQPTIHKKILLNSDMVIMFTDGVVDNFGGLDELQKFVNYQITTNPQELANIILDETMFRCKNKPQDDCTVVCTRVFPRV